MRIIILIPQGNVDSGGHQTRQWRHYSDGCIIYNCPCHEAVLAKLNRNLCCLSQTS